MLNFVLTRNPAGHFSQGYNYRKLENCGPVLETDGREDAERHKVRPYKIRGSQSGLPYKLICENVRMVSSADKKRESHFLFCTPHPCPEWGVSLYFEKCLPAFCVVGGIDCVRDSKVGTP